MHNRSIALVSVATVVAAGLAGCAAGSSGDPIASSAQATSTALPPSTASPLPTWPSGPDIVSSDPTDWDDLTLCLNRTVLVPEGYFLDANSTSEDALRAAIGDVRRPLLEMFPDQVARVRFEAAIPALTVVPAAGQRITTDDVRTAFMALTDVEFDQADALAAVEITAAEGRSFAYKCAIYAEADAAMAANSDQEPRLTSLSFDIERGIIEIGAEDPSDPRFDAFEQYPEVVELHQEDVSAGL